MIDTKSKPPIVWSISNSDSCGGTGVQSDLKTFHDFSVCGCNVVTVINAQNSFASGYSSITEHKAVVAQINALDSDLPASAIKLGVIPSRQILETILRYFDDYDGLVVYDMELETSGEQLLAESAELVRTALLPRVNVLIVNVEEAIALIPGEIDSLAAMADKARQIQDLGCGTVMITGAKFVNAAGQRFDYWCDADSEYWLTINELRTVNNRGGGTVLSAAITAALAKGLATEEVLKVAKSYVTQGIRGAFPIGSGPGAVSHLGWPEDPKDAPFISTSMPSLD